jgi:hypothetical protein
MPASMTLWQYSKQDEKYDKNSHFPPYDKIRPMKRKKTDAGSDPGGQW